MEAVLTNFPAPDIPRRMGRPPLGVESTNVRLSKEAKAAIRELVGEQGMAQFIREAIEREIKRRQRLDRD
jgi:hypothetical protein